MSTGATLIELLAVALGGGTGAAARYALDTHLKSQRGWAPLWSLAVVNLLGTIVLGLALGFVLQHSDGAGQVLGKTFDSSRPLSILFPLLGVGIAGGFTTFSTVMVEVFTRPQPARRIAGVVGMAVVCCAVFLPALWCGALLAGA